MLFDQLPTALQLHVLSLLTPNERALSGRFVCREVRDALKNDCTASLSQPLPPHAAPWAQEAGQEHVRRLTCRRKLQLLCTAAASGSEVNLDVAWTLLQPSIFADMLRSPCGYYSYPDPGEAAARSCHPQLLGWLVRHCPAMLRPAHVLKVAARHCSLAGLQAAWGVLQRVPCIAYGYHQPVLNQVVLDAAAGSTTPDAVAKVEWLREAANARACSLQAKTFEAAARSGDLGRLQWLRDRGCAPDDGAVERALQHADLSVAQWLVDEAGCELPRGDLSSWDSMLQAAAQSSDGLTKLRWLQERGCPQLRGQTLLCVALRATSAGRVDLLRSLLPLFGDWDVLRSRTPQAQLILMAVRSGDTALVEYLRQAGLRYDASAYTDGASRGNLAMIEWLARNSGVPPSKLRWRDLKMIIHVWPRLTAADSRGLLEAVQLLAGAGYSDWPLGNEPAKAMVSTAAERGDLAVVQYLLQRMPGLRLDGCVLTAAAKGGCEALVEWLAEQHPGCLVIPRDTSPYADAARSGDRGTLVALRRLGVPWGRQDVVVQAVSEGCRMPVLRWLVEQGAPVGRRWDMAQTLMNAPEQYNTAERAWLRGLAVVPGAPAAGAAV